jgi:pimeloyl-ACP methyl ester carboxylesterase
MVSCFMREGKRASILGNLWTSHLVCYEADNGGQLPTGAVAHHDQFIRRCAQVSRPSLLYSGWASTQARSSSYSPPKVVNSIPYTSRVGVRDQRLQTADDALALIDALALEHPVLIGHSWGGATALVLASGAESQQPVPHLAQVILEDPAYHFGQGDLLPLLSTISVPTLLIRADATLGTTLDEAAWQQAQEALPAHSRAIEIQGASHNVHRSQFEACMRVINDFLKHRIR